MTVQLIGPKEEEFLYFLY